MSSPAKKLPLWTLSPGVSGPVGSRASGAEARDLAARLQQQVERLQQRGSTVWQDRTDSILSSGCPQLDQRLPAGGLVRGTLVEWLGGGRSGAASGLDATVGGSGGAAALALIAAREALWEGGVLVVFDRLRHFYPPVAAAFGVDLEKVVVIRAGTVEEELWALDQTLRCPAVAAVWAPLEDLQTVARRDPHWFRRLQLAAEQGGVLGLFIRPSEVQGEPSWSDLQLRVHPVASYATAEIAAAAATPAQRDPRWQLQLEITRCRGGAAGGRLQLELDEVQGRVRPVSMDPSHSSFPAPSHSKPSEDSRDDSDGLPDALHLVSPLAHSKIRRRSTGS